MKITALGLDFKGKPLMEPMDYATAAKALVDSLERNANAVRQTAKSASEGVTFRGEQKRITLDPGDPRTAGWTILMNSNDPQRSEIENALEPLANHRSMVNDHELLLYNNEPADEWENWLYDNYYGLNLEGKKVPQYILIVGGPDQVPFLFQSLLDSVANVGRVDFDTMEDLKAYIEKLIRIENADAPVVTRDAVLFAPDGGVADPTYFSRKYMVKPISKRIKEKIKFRTHTMLGTDATKMNLLEVLDSVKPAIVYTASHGLGATDESFEFQKRYNGAICCQHVGPLTLDALFSADDIPEDRPFLEGAVFFQFACFGYGTPAESDYAHWLDGVPEKYTDADFVAAIPKKLLAHPRGPVAFIGHLDTAFLHAFVDIEDPHILDRWHTRIAPFVSAVDYLLQVQPSGLAMQDMSNKYGTSSLLITNTWDRYKRGRFEWNEEREARFLDNWITRGDAQNYMIYGDPAARLRVPSK
jgi:hypothetical protein